MNVYELYSNYRNIHTAIKNGHTNFDNVFLFTLHAMLVYGTLDVVYWHILFNYNKIRTTSILQKTDTEHNKVTTRNQAVAYFTS